MDHVNNKNYRTLEAKVELFLPYIHIQHRESTQSEALTQLQSEERDLEQQVSQLLAVLESTGNISTAGRMKSLLLTRGDPSGNEVCILFLPV